MNACPQPRPAPPAPVVHRLQIVTTVNGPGEISSWFYPFAQALAACAPEVRLSAALLPCVFATGCEQDVLRAIPGVAGVCPPKDSIRCILRGVRPASMAADLPGIVLHMGGEPLLAILLARRLALPLLAYAEHKLPLASRFERIFLTDPLPAARNGHGRYAVVGNMMVDAARLRCPVRHPSGDRAPTLGIFTGSRDYMVKHMLPFFTRVAGHVSEALPETRWLLGKADYVSLEMLRRSAEDPAGRLIEGENARWEPGQPCGALVSERGVRIEVLPPGEVMARANLILTIPGTNTAELTALGIPMVVLVPTYSAEVHPMPGMLGHLDRLPLLGRYVKRAGAHAYHRYVGYLSHPNRKRRAEVVPEISGRITTRQVADRVLATLARPLEPTSRELLSIMGPPGATQRLVDEVMAWMRNRLPR